MTRSKAPVSVGGVYESQNVIVVLDAAVRATPSVCADADATTAAAINAAGKPKAKSLKRMFVPPPLAGATAGHSVDTRSRAARIGTNE